MDWLNKKMDFMACDALNYKWNANSVATNTN